MYYIIYGDIHKSALHQFKWDSSVCESFRNCDKYTLKKSILFVVIHVLIAKMSPE